MNWQKKITKLFSAAFFLLFLFSCNGDGCVEADEFDNEFVRVDANPTSDGVYGTYNNDNGGQTANWHSTDLRSNGEGLLIHITGAWTPWYGQQMTNDRLNNLPLCQTCAKRGDQSVGNCICYSGQTPQPEIGIAGTPINTNCSLSSNQNDPSKCTCTQQNGNATAYGVFHFPLAFYNKNHTVKLPDEQAPACKYKAGMGLYIGLFGSSGTEMPTRAYHMFSQTSICTITRNSNGECIDSQGNDRTRYVFRSANDRNLMKDDHNNNDGTDTNTSDDTYHRANEFIKLIIQDQYYSDNYGSYNVIFLKGLIRDGDTGLLEYLVSIVEDAVLGKVDDDGTRHGSVIEYMYKAIVQDTYFAATLQICLSLYIAFFGLATLFGLAEINSKKELIGRTVKIGLIIMFTNPSSWYFYNQIIVGFFKDSMDFLITFITNLSDSNLDDDTDPIKIAQMARATTDSDASRFSYIDSIIKMLFSENVTKKIWGLFFSTFFGFVYIIAIYLLIFYFLYVMLLAATIYTITLIKLVFVLALGPLFISFSLFSQTSGMFKKWVAFLGARSLEIVLLFLVLYPFVMIIDQKIIGLLSFRTCFEHFGIGHFQFSILKSYHGRGFADWIHDLVTIGGLLFILQMILDQVPKVAEALISIQGEGGSADDTKGTASLASSIMKFASGTGYSAVSSALSTAGAVAFRGARLASRKSGLSGAMDYAFNKIPFRGPRARLRDSIIDDALKQARNKVLKDNPALGKDGNQLDLEKAIRNAAFNDPKFGLNAYKYGSSDPKAAGGRTKAALYGLTSDNIAKRMDEKLVNQPLKDYLKKRAKELKGADANNIKLGKDAHKQLEKDARDWAKKNILGGEGSIDDNLRNLKSFMKGELKLSSNEAAKKFAGNEAGKNRYMQHLIERKQDRNEKNKNKWFKFNAKGATDFARKVGYEEERGKGFMDKHLGINTAKGFSLLKRVGFLDRRFGRYQDQKDNALAAASRDYVTSGKAERDKEKLTAHYQSRQSEFEEGPYRRKLQDKLDARLAEVDRNFLAMKHIMEQDAFRKQQDEIARLGTEAERSRLLAQRELEYQQMLSRQLEESRALMNNPDYKNQMALNGGALAYQNGTIPFDGNTLAEAQARLMAFGDGQDMMGLSSSKIAIPVDGLQNFGGDISKSLSASTSGTAPDNSALKAAFDAEKGAARQIKELSSKKRQYVEYDLKQEQAKKGDDKDERKIKELEAELKDIDADISRQETKIATLDQQLKDINS